MTEAEWLECQEPEKMLEYLRGRASDRKLRLFAVACCRRIWPLVEKDAARYIEAAERYADGLLSDSEMKAAAWLAEQRAREGAEGRGWNPSPSAQTRAAVAAATSIPMTVRAAQQAAGQAMEAAADTEWGGHRLTPHEESRAVQAALLRCIIGNPFKPISIVPAVLAWNQGTVVKMAAVIYEERRWEDMPLLGDALEEASGANRAILGHCRGPEPHARGCHVIDTVLDNK